MFSALARFRVPPRDLGSGVGLTDGTDLGAATMGVAVGTTTGVGILVAVEIGPGVGVGVCAPRTLGVGVAATLGVRVGGTGAKVGFDSGSGWSPQDTDHNSASPKANPANE